MCTWLPIVYADMARFPTRVVFARAMVESFSTSMAKVDHWVCCWEKHRKGGGHYHLAIKLNWTETSGGDVQTLLAAHMWDHRVLLEPSSQLSYCLTVRH